MEQQIMAKPHWFSELMGWLKDAPEAVQITFIRATAIVLIILGIVVIFFIGKILWKKYGKQVMEKIGND